MLEDKVILVTGGASGIGAAAASLFARYGARVVVTDRDGDGAARIAAALPDTAAIAADVTSPEAMRAAVALAVQRFGRLDFAFNNAGVEQAGAAMTALADYPLDDFDRVLAINLRGALVSLQAEIPALRVTGGGSIVFTASVMGWLAAPGMGAYAASKHGVVGLTRAAALDHAGDNIRVNAVLPGAVATPMLTERAFHTNPGYAGAAAAHPLGRIADPREIAEGAAWLLSDRASFVTGHALAIDGGFSAR